MVPGMDRKPEPDFTRSPHRHPVMLDRARASGSGLAGGLGGCPERGPAEADAAAVAQPEPAQGVPRRLLDGAEFLPPSSCGRFRGERGQAAHGVELWGTGTEFLPVPAAKVTA